jgi:glycogen phosphorylase
MHGSRFSLEVNARIPDNLGRLPELAGNLIYSWDRDLRRLFRYLDSDLYDDCSGNLKLFLRRVDQQRIDEAAGDPTFVRSY